MTSSKFLYRAILALTLSLSACSANSAEMKAEQTNDYLKPGASVTYSHNLKSQLSAGEAAAFKLTLGESYSEGQLKVSLTTEGDIDLFASSTQARFDMAEDTNHVMNISLTANSNGRHYINVLAEATNAAGVTQPRIFSIPVQVGPVTAQKPNPDMKKMPGGENIIEMDAEEEIK